MPSPSPSPKSLTPRAAVVLLAAGEGRRVGSETNKVLLPLAGSPVFAWSLRWIHDMENVERVVVVVREQDRGVVEQVLADRFRGRDIDVVSGGPTRHESEWNALTAIAGQIDAGGIDVVAIHDAARPLAGPHLFSAVIEAAGKHGGALPVRERPALLPRDATSARDIGAGRLVGVQTPQAFRAGPLLDAYRRAAQDGFAGTDTASCVERYADLPIHGVSCSATNLKITYPEDVALAERLLDELDLR